MHRFVELVLAALLIAAAACSGAATDVPTPRTSCNGMRFHLLPRDTTLNVGGSLEVRPTYLDLSGSEVGPRPDSVVYSAPAAAGVAIDSLGRVKALSLGQTYIHAANCVWSDSLAIDVVPSGRIAAIWHPVDVFVDQRIFMFNTDGSQLQSIDAGSWCTDNAQWAPDGTWLVVSKSDSNASCNEQRLHRMSPTGADTRLNLDTTSLNSEDWPRVTSDGQWIYFTGRPGSQNGEVWRVRSDGSQESRVGPSVDAYTVELAPAPAPASSAVLFTWQRDDTTKLETVDAVTGAVTDLATFGAYASWSPSGDRIVYTRSEQYYVANTDGSSEVPLSGATSPPQVPTPPVWVSDRFILLPVPWGSGTSSLAFFDLVQQKLYKLGWTGQMGSPTYHP